MDNNVYGKLQLVVSFINDLESKIDNDIVNLESKIDDNITNINGNISTLNNNVITISEDVKALNNNIISIFEDVKSLNSDVKQLSEIVTNQLENLYEKDNLREPKADFVQNKSQDCCKLEQPLDLEMFLTMTQKYAVENFNDDNKLFVEHYQFIENLTNNELLQWSILIANNNMYIHYIQYGNFQSQYGGFRGVRITDLNILNRSNFYVNHDFVNKNDLMILPNLPQGYPEGYIVDKSIYEFLSKPCNFDYLQNKDAIDLGFDMANNRYQSNYQNTDTHIYRLYISNLLNFGKMIFGKKFSFNVEISAYVDITNLSILDKIKNNYPLWFLSLTTNQEIYGLILSKILYGINIQKMVLYNYKPRIDYRDKMVFDIGRDNLINLYGDNDYKYLYKTDLSFRYQEKLYSIMKGGIVYYDYDKSFLADKTF